MSKTMTAQRKTASKMSDMMIECELRLCWTEVECAVRHGIQPTKALSDYTAALVAEQTARKAR
jgi:hypothetical protein